MSILLFVVYLLLFTYWLYRWGKKHLSNINWRRVLLFAFILRVGVGLFFGFYTRNLENNDYWRLFRESKEETDWLLHDTPKFFYKDILDNNGYSGNPFTSFFFKNGNNMYFNDLRDNLIIKFNAVLNVFSGYNYYVNVLIANFLVMWCLLGLASVFRYWLNPRYTWTVLGVLLLYPPLILWTSNIQKDMVCLMLLAVILFTYSFRKGKSGAKRFLYWTAFFAAVFIMLLMKNYMAIILVGSLMMVWVARPSSPSFAKRFWILLGCVFGLFCVSSFFPNSVNFALLLARKQKGFYDVNGDQPIPSIALSGDIVTYLRNLPHAVMNVFFFPLEKSLLYDRIGWIGGSSCLLFLMLTILAFRFPTRKELWKNPFFLIMFAFCLLNYLLIGECVAYYGALLRYRCIAETVFCLLLLQLIDFQKIKHLYINNKNI